MPSTNKTTHFGLNNWSGTDKPKRIDFVQDNETLDQVLYAHFQDTDLHFSPEEREAFSNRLITGSYIGTGDAQKVLNISSSAVKACFIFPIQRPFCEPDAAKGMLVHSGFACASGGTGGITLSAGQVLVQQSQQAENGYFWNLNEKAKTYLYFALQ